jgi:drug/metabolite transporter (DMT)-like permease
MIPSIMDFTSSSMQYFALNFIPGSIYQMLKGGSLITTALFSYLLMRTKLKRNHISGCILAFIGVFIVGASSLIFKSASSAYSIVDIFLI